MKRKILAWFGLLYVSAFVVASWAACAAGYFGFCDGTSALALEDGYTFWTGTDSPVVNLTGSIDAIEFLGYNNGLAASHYRLAVYNSTGTNLICQGSAAKDLATSETSEIWRGHGSGELSGTCAVSSGSTYIVALTAEHAGVHIKRLSGQASGINKYASSALYTSGFPDSLPSGSNSVSERCMRFHVTEESPSSTIRKKRMLTLGVG